MTDHELPSQAMATVSMTDLQRMSDSSAERVLRGVRNEFVTKAELQDLMKHVAHEAASEACEQVTARVLREVFRININDDKSVDEALDTWRFVLAMRMVGKTFASTGVKAASMLMLTGLGAALLFWFQTKTGWGGPKP